MSKIFIKQLTPKDAQIFKEFRLFALKENPESFGSTYEDYKKTKLSQVKAGIKRTIIFAAFKNGKIVGVTGLTLYSFAKAAHKAEINMTFVSKEVRGQGVGKRLMNEIFKKAKLLKLEQINLAVVVGNKAATRLYNSIGFKKFGVEKRALKNDGEYFDELHMVKFL